MVRGGGGQCLSAGGGGQCSGDPSPLVGDFRPWDWCQSTGVQSYVLGSLVQSSTVPELVLDHCGWGQFLTLLAEPPEGSKVHAACWLVGLKLP